MRGLRVAVLVMTTALAISACARGVTASEGSPGAAKSQDVSRAPTIQVEGEPAVPSSDATQAPSNPETAARDSAFVPVGTVVDKQGAVEVAVTLLESEWRENGKLVFQVEMNTHSVDLSMDLAKLANLESDNGLSLRAGSWSGGSGHHVVGYLDFGVPDLEVLRSMAHARRWDLTLRQIDAPEQVFAWYLGSSQ